MALAGITLMVISFDPEKYDKIIKVWGGGFFLIGVIMLLAGIFLHLHIVFFAPDFICCPTDPLSLTIFGVIVTNFST